MYSSTTVARFATCQSYLNLLQHKAEVGLPHHNSVSFFFWLFVLGYTYREKADKADALASLQPLMTPICMQFWWQDIAPFCT